MLHKKITRSVLIGSVRCTFVRLCFNKIVKLDRCKSNTAIYVHVHETQWRELKQCYTYGTLSSQWQHPALKFFIYDVSSIIRKQCKTISVCVPPVPWQTWFVHIVIHFRSWPSLYSNLNSFSSMVFSGCWKIRNSFKLGMCRSEPTNLWSKPFPLQMEHVLAPLVVIQYGVTNLPLTCHHC